MILNLIALQLLAQGNNHEVIDDKVNPGRWFFYSPRSNQFNSTRRALLTADLDFAFWYSIIL